MEKYKSFMWGVALAAIFGYSAYNHVNTENKYLRGELREQEVETADIEMKTIEFITQVSETEKQNAESFQEIIHAAKKYSSIIYEQAKGHEVNPIELISLHKKLEQHADKIHENNKQMFGIIEKYVKKEKELAVF